MGDFNTSEVLMQQDALIQWEPLCIKASRCINISVVLKPPVPLQSLVVLTPALY
jgi:hypothetical protein